MAMGSFKVAAPTELYKLSQVIRTVESITEFRKQMKTNQIRLAEPPPQPTCP